jgi:hypothetical protein
LHTDEQIDHLVESLGRLWAACPLSSEARLSQAAE